MTNKLRSAIREITWKRWLNGLGLVKKIKGITHMVLCTYINDPYTSSQSCGCMRSETDMGRHTYIFNLSKIDM